MPVHLRAVPRDPDLGVLHRPACPGPLREGPLIFAMNAFNWDEVGAILCGLIILVLFVEIISTKIRTKLARG